MLSNSTNTEILLFDRKTSKLNCLLRPKSSSKVAQAVHFAKSGWDSEWTQVDRCFDSGPKWFKEVFSEGLFAMVLHFWFIMSNTSMVCFYKSSIKRFGKYTWSFRYYEQCRGSDENDNAVKWNQNLEEEISCCCFFLREFSPLNHFSEYQAIHSGSLFEALNWCYQSTP